MRLSEALASYTVQLAADGRSPHTIAQATRHGRLLVAALDDPEAASVGHGMIARFLASDAVKLTATGTPRRPASANALRSSVRCLFAYLHASGLASSNAARLVRRARSRSDHTCLRRPRCTCCLPCNGRRPCNASA